MRIVWLTVLLLLLTRRTIVTPVCHSRTVPALTLKGGLNILFLTGSFYVANLNTYGANLGEQLLSS